MPEKKKYPDNKKENAVNDPAPAEAVYAGPEMRDVYGGPEFFGEKGKSRGGRKRPPIALVYAGPEYFKKKNRAAAAISGRVCRNCGRAFEDDFKYCPECGVLCGEPDTI